MRTTRRKLKRKTPFVICCLLLLTVLAGCGMLLKDMLPVKTTDITNIFEPTPDRLNVLLLGIDARQGETMARTDTMILASVDQKSKQVALLSIPRDTRVNIPGYGMDKINSASAYGGPELSTKVVSQLLGTQIKYYVLVNFSGFKDIVDALGGVTFDVEQSMYHWDEDPALEINLKKGVQRLDGDKALQYVRYRDYPMGDIDRTKYQQKFLVALGKEMLQPATIPKLPRLVTEINRYVKTNMPATDLYKLATASKNMENGNFVAQTLPGRPLDINGGSYWGVDPTEAKQVLAKLFKGETETNVVLTTPLSGQYAGSSDSSAVSQKTSETAAGTAQTNQQPGAQTQQGQNGTRQQTGSQKTDKSGKTGTQNSGTSGASGSTVTITPVGAGTGTSTSGSGKATGNDAGTQSGAGTGSSDKSSTSPDAVQSGANPGIPGVKAKT
ncbi:MAG: Regulatory protein MsrR [Pelotomaculum sp. PtaB.Bin013]|uniref:LCP family protein n=1 Tax=Pelotomaculum isophthalicicum JI TaxID=947010 RepID=A0A9X4H414_9FIRM|nr:LCP family protein [Pelotomaculum isophthalicicum]MDF9406953.1 LCP family protein [Pelotomaculum isophthalicicum JI]OPX90142.1 MAG: Regulatory protein MsrR [Pelotomaculum sp. PtaB.Bin013]